MYFIPKQMMSKQTGISSLIVKDVPLRHVNTKEFLSFKNMYMTSETLSLPSPRGVHFKIINLFQMYYVLRQCFRHFTSSQPPHEGGAIPMSLLQRGNWGTDSVKYLAHGHQQNGSLKSEPSSPTQGSSSRYCSPEKRSWDMPSNIMSFYILHRESQK